MKRRERIHCVAVCRYRRSKPQREGVCKHLVVCGNLPDQLSRWNHDLSASPLVDVSAYLDGRSRRRRGATKTTIRTPFFARRGWGVSIGRFGLIDQDLQAAQFLTLIERAQR